MQIYKDCPHNEDSAVWNDLYPHADRSNEDFVFIRTDCDNQYIQIRTNRYETLEGFLEENEFVYRRVKNMKDMATHIFSADTDDIEVILRKENGYYSCILHLDDLYVYPHEYEGFLS